METKDYGWEIIDPIHPDLIPKPLEEEVRKHQEHDQKTHGNWAALVVGDSGSAGLQYPTQRSNPELKDILRDYVVEYPVGAGHEIVNKTLRKTEGYDNVTSEFSSEITSRITGLDRLVEISPPLTEQTNVFRGIGGPFARELEAKGVGGSFTDNGFSSVSLNRGVAAGFPSRPMGNILEIALPAGTKAINPSKFFTRNVVGSTDLRQEQELILGRGTTFDILEIVGNVEYGVGKIIRVRVRK